MMNTLLRSSRDSNISFEDIGHKYTVVLPNDELLEPKSVTTLIHQYFPSFNSDLVINKMMNSSNWVNSKYYGKTKIEIQKEWENNGAESSALGTDMHAHIENYLNDGTIDPVYCQTKEFQYFMNFWRTFQTRYPNHTNVRSEWMIYDEDIKVAGSVDCLASDNSGNTILLDWKRSKEIKLENRFEKGYPPFQKYDNCNYYHYSLQLNFYRHILETKYQVKIDKMAIIILHPDQLDFQYHDIGYIDLAPFWSTINKDIKH